MFWITHLIRGVASFGAAYFATGWIVEKFVPGHHGLHLAAAVVLALAMLAAFATTEAEL